MLVVGPDNKNYIVPEFILPALDQDYHAGKRKEGLMVFSAPGTVSKAMLSRPSCTGMLIAGVLTPAC